MHLRCEDHERRILVTEIGVFHRNGDGSPCGSVRLIYKERAFTARAIRLGAHTLTRVHQVYDPATRTYTRA